MTRWKASVHDRVKQFSALRTQNLGKIPQDAIYSNQIIHRTSTVHILYLLKSTHSYLIHTSELAFETFALRLASRSGTFGNCEIWLAKTNMDGAERQSVHPVVMDS